MFAGLAHRMTESRTVPEPWRDIVAQLRCLSDPAHPKKAVYLADATAAPATVNWLPSGTYASLNGKGIFVTTDFRLYQWFDHLEAVTDEDLARALGYPESKGEIADQHEGVMAIQARDVNDCVVFEACCSDKGRNATIEAVKRQVPSGGRLVFTTLAAIIQRRLAEN